MKQGELIKCKDCRWWEKPNQPEQIQGDCCLPTVNGGSPVAGIGDKLRDATPTGPEFGCIFAETK